MQTGGVDECGAFKTELLETTTHPKYSCKIMRLNSFIDWPRCMRQRPVDLAAAGFFYTGQGDKVLCFQCGGGLKDWEPEDDPWQQHVQWFNQCVYVKQRK
ncbi:hypothetical protein K1T71_001526 [Dendrolimus kikuchii]|uniref:Uncharacterized protein n=1 Tax=Dendrolimus kikuchii TaxID=765133 RepID=A0ACC1DIC9_9NEOP|nr:hypothetical protein K1T71_001526 [Dendrolimus kikuchii]